LLSRNEGFGIVTAEALACGVPVVGSDVVGTQEVIDDCKAGRLVPLGDESAAAAASVELYAKRDELAKVGRDYVASRFSKEIWRRKIEAFYNAILSGARSP
ncbi:MAG: glycosyltransferase, partial [Woeseiaceae bacterium]|nr:glycosyltransferase [Woeseiaceae bacterium]